MGRSKSSQRRARLWSASKLRAASPAAWERLLVDAAVIGGPERWKARLAGLREEFHRRYREEEDEDERARIERRIAHVDQLRDFAMPVIGRLAELPERAAWGEWIA